MKRLLLILIGLAMVCPLLKAYAQNVEFVTSYNTPGNALGVFVSGQFAYVADSDSGLLILDVSDPSNPEPVGSLESGIFESTDVSVSGDYAYVKEIFCFWGGCGGAIKIVDVSDPTAPDSVGATAVGFPFDFSVSGNYAYITKTNFDFGGDVLYIIDVSRPDSTFVVGSYFPNCCFSDVLGAVFISGSNLYVICCSYFEIWDVSDPYNAGVTGSCVGGCMTDIFVAGDYAYEACDESGLGIVDVSNPSSPYYVGASTTRGPARDIFVSGHYVYVAERDSGLQIFDISEPANPVLAGSYDTPGYARRVCVQGDYIYVADTSSLIILRFTPQTGIEESVKNPDRFLLDKNYPNPFNAATSISYNLPEQGEVSIDIYDLLGRKVQELLKAKQAPGEHQVLWNAGDLPSGIYFARLQAGPRFQAIRMTLLK